MSLVCSVIFIHHAFNANIIAKIITAPSTHRWRGFHQYSLFLCNNFINVFKVNNRVPIMIL